MNFPPHQFQLFHLHPCWSHDSCIFYWKEKKHPPQDKSANTHMISVPSSCPFKFLDQTQCVGLAYQGKDIVFGFIIEYSSLRDFGP
jgi:hypothetical protein